MQLILNKYQIKLISSLIINNLHYNFIILNNKLIFTHSLNKLQIKELKKLLKKHYYKYKLVWHYDIMRNDILTLINSKQIYTYKHQYTIRLINDNTYIKKIIINNLNSKLWQTLLTQKDLLFANH